MTAVAIIEAARQAGVELSTNDAGGLVCHPAATGDLRAQLVAHKPSVIDVLRAMHTATQLRAAATFTPVPDGYGQVDRTYTPDVIDLTREGLGPQYIAEMERQDAQGLVVLYPCAVTRVSDDGTALVTEVVQAPAGPQLLGTTDVARQEALGKGATQAQAIPPSALPTAAGAPLPPLARKAPPLAQSQPAAASANSLAQIG